MLNGSKSISRDCLKSSESSRKLSDCLKGIFSEKQKTAAVGTHLTNDFLYHSTSRLTDPCISLSSQKAITVPFSLPLISSCPQTDSLLSVCMTYCLTLCPLFMQQPYFTPMWCCRGCSFCLPPLREPSLGRIGLFVMPAVLLGTTERMETLMLLFLRFLARDWESKWPVSKSEMFDVGAG